MGRNSAIEWTTHTFNPWIGCTRISPACDHCYAADWDKRYHGGEHWGSGAPRQRTSKSNWRQPYKWARQAREAGERPRVFCCSLADVFDNQVPAEWREDLWQVIRDTPELDWLLLTKRIGNVRQMLPEDWGDGWPHVWLGITVVTQAEAIQGIRRIDLKAIGEKSTEVQDWSARQTTLEQIEARSGSGKLPSGFTFHCKVYPETAGRDIDVRLSIRTSQSEPILIARIVGQAALEKVIAEEVELELCSRLQGLRVFIGQV